MTTGGDLVDLGLERDVVDLDLVSPQVERGAEDLADVERDLLGGRLARECEEVLNDLLHPIGFVMDDLEPAAGRGRDLFVFEEELEYPRIPVSGLLISWATPEIISPRAESFRLEEPLFHRLLVREIARDAQDGRLSPCWMATALMEQMRVRPSFVTRGQRSIVPRPAAAERRTASTISSGFDAWRRSERRIFISASRPCPVRRSVSGLASRIAPVGRV